ncbi:hypothetical protein NQ317_019633 [Molorchus minor]|uniref:Voltage-dependent calcium channel subunit alpha-2/delta-3 n=1 Tax=Molorchus minor TaxID=1323400 RepID=A0ABQ9JBW1_9CUCU|nr:hypothetical protein NQ317_019633 [Molorchus minor]
MKMIFQVTFLLIFLFLKQMNCSSQGEQVEHWARNLSNQLKHLGESITLYKDIQREYKFLNAKVVEKKPHELLAEMKENIAKMIDRKMDAIECIQQEAEDVAENFEFNRSVPFTYYSSKWSEYNKGPVIYTNELNNTELDDIPANMSDISIQVPTNSTNSTTKSKQPERFPKIPESLKDNEYMYMPMTLNNDTHFYNLLVNTSYSSVHVPTNIYDKEDAAAFAIQWSEALDKVFVQNYNSDPALSWQYFGSSSGIMRHYPAKPWEEHKRDLFDCRIRPWYIEAATCTKDVIILIDNSGSMRGMGHHIGSLTVSSLLNTLSNNDFINVMNYSAVTNYTIPCFENMLVQATRENIEVIKVAVDKLSPEGKTDLGQALEVAFNLLSKLAKEVANAAEVKWISCANRGYYTHVQTLEQVTASVLQYINVVARPLVLQGKDHPISWTHAYVDLTYNDKNDDVVNEPYRLLTSAAIPCYDTKINKMNDTRTAYLLGVAGTDVPLEEFSKLMVPYKLGVNGYAFIVSNNGYVLMHPDLRPVWNSMLMNIQSQEKIGDSLKKLRKTLVDAEEGSTHGIQLRYHYDNMRRISEEYFDYYYTKLEKTPFSLGIAIPSTVSSVFPYAYGNYTLEVGDVIQKHKHADVNFTSFFTGKWRIHPRWTYCKYHYLEGHEFKTPESELEHFLIKMYDNDFKWERQYEEPSSKSGEYQSKVDCGRKTLASNSYYCDKELIQKLIFDAESTQKHYSRNWRFAEGENNLFYKFGTSLRFVATMSGLTRWDYLVDMNKTKEFGDINPRAINEKWYKSAILQRQYEEDAFVYSVPFDAGSKDDPLVTGSYAIFASDGGREAPGSVVGFQFSQAKLANIVWDISNKLATDCPDCLRCNGSLICYILDSSGYIIVSLGNNKDTGKFFGEVEGDIFNSMINNYIFKNITIYDYQALCKKNQNADSSASVLLTPFLYLKLAVQWIVLKIVYFATEISLYNILNAIPTYAEEILNGTIGLDTNNTKSTNDDQEQTETEKSNYYACETVITLFVLQQNIFKNADFLGEIKQRETRDYYVKKIQYSNLIFVAIDTAEDKDDRRRLKGCYNNHPLENEIVDCGRAVEYYA